MLQTSNLFRWSIKLTSIFDKFLLQFLNGKVFKLILAFLLLRCSTTVDFILLDLVLEVIMYKLKLPLKDSHLIFEILNNFLLLFENFRIDGLKLSLKIFNLLDHLVIHNLHLLHFISLLVFLDFQI